MNPVAMIRHVTDGDLSYDGLMFVCPGCLAMYPESTGLHMLPVNAPAKSPSWDWDGSLDAPTLSPSILTKHGPVVDGVGQVCHSFLQGGVFDYLSDCTHSLVGQRVPMVPLPDWVME